MRRITSQAFPTRTGGSWLASWTVALLSITTLTASAATDDAKPGETAVISINLSLQQTSLIIAVLIVAVICIYMVFFFGRRLQGSAYIRDSLVATARQQELRSLLREVDERANEGPLDSEDQPPSEFGPVQQLWTSGIYVPYEERLGRTSPSETPEEKQAREKNLENCRAWEKRERARKKALTDKAEAEAAKRADARIPRSMDISLLGGGWSFLLEFTTVIVIIFALLVLGIAGIVLGKDITTILASIAGYVLGKATSQSRDAGRPNALSAVDDPSKTPAPNSRGS